MCLCARAWTCACGRCDPESRRRLRRARRLLLLLAAGAADARHLRREVALRHDDERQGVAVGGLQLRGVPRVAGLRDVSVRHVRGLPARAILAGAGVRAGE